MHRFCAGILLYPTAMRSIFFSNAEQRKKGSWRGGDTPSAARLPEEPFCPLTVRPSPHSPQNSECEGPRKDCRPLQSFRHVQTLQADDGALAPDHEAGQWRLLQRKPDRLHGLLRKEWILRDRLEESPHICCPREPGSIQGTRVRLNVDDDSMKLICLSMISSPRSSRES